MLKKNKNQVKHKIGLVNAFINGIDETNSIDMTILTTISYIIMDFHKQNKNKKNIEHEEQAQTIINSCNDIIKAIEVFKSKTLH